MKIHQIALGESFEYEGQTYVKTGPVTAASAAGGARMIPRHAVLSPPGTAAARRQAEPLTRAKVEAAFEKFYVVSVGLLPAESLAALAEARRQFLADLD